MPHTPGHVDPAVYGQQARGGAAPAGDSMPQELRDAIALGIVQARASGGTPATGVLPSGRSVTIRLRDDGDPVDPPADLIDSGLRRAWRDRQAQSATYSTIDAAISSWYQMSDGRRESLMEQMFALGLIDGPNNEAQATQKWGSAVELAFNYAAAGRTVDPESMLSRMTAQSAGGLGLPRVQTQSRVNLMDPATAQSFIRGSFRQQMGRDPHPSELRQLASALNRGARENPATATTTTSSDGTQSTTVNDPGFNAEAFMQDVMDSDPEARAHEAAARYYGMFKSLMDGPV